MSRVIGIDLGTSTSEVAYVKDGKPVVIPNLIGEIITPSAINISPEKEITVGSQAREKVLLEPEQTFMEVKRLIGSDKLLECHGQAYTPEEMSSFILKYLVKSASDFLGEEVKRAVITVPAYFSDKQRRATMEAGRLCGLTVERIINEPTAAALSYGIENMENCSNILVYDLGGGTLDVTVLEMFEGVLDVKASSGNNQLGGKDFDEAVIQYLLEQIPLKARQSVKGDLRALARLKHEAEAAKISLSFEETYHVTLPFLTQSGGSPVSLDIIISREQFESLISDKIEGTRQQITTALKDAKMTISEVDLILLVGGSTRIPLVETFIVGVFGKSPQHLVDPDLAVVKGAAVQAAILEGVLGGDSLVLTDVCPFTLGIAAWMGDEMFGDLGFSAIIPRNVTIPVTKEKKYYTLVDNQTQVDIVVYQGESFDLEKNYLLDNFLLSGIPPKKAGKESITVSFSYDVNGILKVTALVDSTGEEAAITIKADKHQVPFGDIDLDKWEDSPQSAKFKSVIKKAEKMLKTLEGDDALEEMIEELKEAVILGRNAEILQDLKDDLVEYLLELEEDE
ncbi:MAG: Hsp70 family protein [Turicibacter sp.]|nr:Hsp70 family protein [Turicibacter sp.]